LSKNVSTGLLLLFWNPRDDPAIDSLWVSSEYSILAEGRKIGLRGDAKDLR
jgi:hypothetical protein